MVESSQPAPFGTAGPSHQLPSAGSSTESAPVDGSGAYAVVNRSATRWIDHERGVDHAEWLEQSAPQEIFERHLRRAFDQHAEHLDAGVIHPAFAGLVRERQRAEPLGPLVDRVTRRRPRRTERAQLERFFGISV